jgi:poly(hydroxyalkanoate) depolymerase family esterase
VIRNSSAMLRSLARTLEGSQTLPGLMTRDAIARDAMPRDDSPADAAAQLVAAPSSARVEDAHAGSTSLAGSFGEYRWSGDSSRRFMLYEPALRDAGSAPLVVMLHGCNQDAEGFAAGTRMNEAAQLAGCFVMYPEQTHAANMMRCWNWYEAQNRERKEGDASLIVAMTQQVMRDHDIDPARVYVAGMSAGGAMAAVLARDYRDVYAALGVHSGVPAGHATDMFSALRLMSSGPEAGVGDALPDEGKSGSLAPPAIVFHGDEDSTVHPSNGEAIHATPGEMPVRFFQRRSTQDTTEIRDGQRSFTRSVDYGPGGITNRELWIVHGAGHAWAGGDAGESYTDESGPDASREMLRFFAQHRLDS